MHATSHASQAILILYKFLTAIDDPHKVVKVIASDGKSGDTREISYSNCKVIGNGSFGVVFQAKLVGGPKEGDDIAIKKVLQDKRFKVRWNYFLRYARDSGGVSDLASNVFDENAD